MESEKQENASNLLFTFIQSNPAAVVVVLAILILLALGSIAAMLRIQGEAETVAQNTLEAVANSTARPTFTPPPTSTPDPTETPVPTDTPIPSPTPTFTPTPIVIDWRELGELDTLEVSTVTVFEDSSPRWWIVPDATVLVRVTGLARFGIDITLAEIQQVTESEGASVRVVLPHAMVTGVELLEAQVYDEQWFPNAQLGVDATTKALNEISLWAAEQDNLLEISEKLAAAELESFLRQLGFEEVEIVFE